MPIPSVCAIEIAQKIRDLETIRPRTDEKAIERDCTSSKRLRIDGDGLFDDFEEFREHCSEAI
jgi:hypothetical protein